MRAWQISVAALALAACTKTPAYLYGRDFNSLKLGPLTANEGIYPDTSVLNDPNNPFAVDPPTDEGKWSLQASASPIAAFYSWATLNALTPGGEAQFYVAKNLDAIYTNMPLDAKDESLREHALHAYNVVLQSFPMSVTYDITGKIAYSLVPPTCQGIVIDLGGMPPAGWALIQSKDSMGNVTVQCVHQ